MQNYLKPQSGATTFGQLYGLLGNTLDTLLSNFSGTEFPSWPVAGQACFRTDRLTAGGVPKLYLYSGLTSLGENGWVEISANSVIGEEVINARGTKSSLDERLDVALNEDGTLKADTTLNPSQWFLPSLEFTYAGTDSFVVNGDQRDIYKEARRLKINLAASTEYTEVLSASYSDPDTIVQVLDHVLDSTLVSVEHSLFLPDWDGKSAISSRMAANHRVKTVTGNYETTLNDEVILVDASAGPITVTVLSAAALGPGRRQKIIKIDNTTNTVTVDPDQPETINGNAAFDITVPLTGIEYESDGFNYRTTDDHADKVSISDVLQDFVAGGLLGVDPGSTLTMTIPAGTAYVKGRRLIKLSGDADLTRTYTASKDTYVDISHTGAVTYTEVANGGGAPSVTANSIRLMKVTTNAGEITAVTDLRTLSSGIKDSTGAVRSVSPTPAAYTVPVSDASGALAINFMPANISSYNGASSLTVTSTRTGLVTNVLGTLNTGGVWALTGELNGTKGGTAGLVSCDITSSGTATVTFMGVSGPVAHSQHYVNATTVDMTFSYIMEVTGGGTCTLTLSGSSLGSNTTSATARLHALRIR